MIAELKKRWDTEPGRAFVENLSRLGRSGNGYEIREAPFGTVTETGRLDLRGLLLPERTELRRITFRFADFTGAVFRHAKTELSVFTDVWFNDSSLRLGEGGSTFEQCSFCRANFRRSVIGYRGSRFKRCHFEKADFIQVGFIRPEFDDSCFDNCTFSGVDFNGGSFERCEFKGEVRGVWFRGGFPLRSWVEEWGEPRTNRMTTVSFKNARLIDITFSDHCDLSSVIPPDDGRHALFDRWPERIKFVFEQSRAWPEPCRREGETFFKSFGSHAEKQDWYLIGVDALVNIFGREPGLKLWETLISTQTVQTEIKKA
jgi:uncharacterized protein YjbI with pentapeptide repeats